MTKKLSPKELRELASKKAKEKSPEKDYNSMTSAQLIREAEEIEYEELEDNVEKALKNKDIFGYLEAVHKLSGENMSGFESGGLYNPEFFFKKIQKLGGTIIDFDYNSSKIKLPKTNREQLLIELASSCPDEFKYDKKKDVVYLCWDE